MELKKRKRRRLHIPQFTPKPPTWLQHRTVNGPNRHAGGELLTRLIHCEYCGATFRAEYYRLEHESRFHG